MGMNVGSSGGGDEPDVMMDINTTPLIDVMLVLLVMLIITIPIQLHAVNMNMPIGNPPPKLKEPEIVDLRVNEQSVVLWNGEVINDRASLEAKMRDEVAKADQPEVRFRPYKQARYDVVAGVMASAQRIGLVKIGIVGGEQFVD